MFMGTRFQIIEGGKLSVNKAVGNRPHSTHKPDFYRKVRASKPYHRGRQRNLPQFRQASFGTDRAFFFAIIMAPVALFYAIWSWPESSTYQDQSAQSTLAFLGTDVESGRFSFCHEGGGYNCVVDGDTIYFQGTKIRIADIDTPETHPPRCAEEARLGKAATNRLQTLLNMGPFQLQSIDRDVDSYGRKLRIITRGGASIGNDLVNSGLARWYEGGRKSWC